MAYFYEHISGFPVYKKESETLHKSKLFFHKKKSPGTFHTGGFFLIYAKRVFIYIMAFSVNSDCDPLALFCFSLLHLFDHHRKNLCDISDNSDIGHIKDGCVLIFIDRYDISGTDHTGYVLGRTGDSACDVELGATILPDCPTWWALDTQPSSIAGLVAPTTPPSTSASCSTRANYPCFPFLFRRIR